MCEECQLRMGSSALRVIPLADAYRVRLGNLYMTLNTHLYAKRQQLLDHRLRLQTHLAQIRQVKGVIEMDMKGEFSALSERLNSAYKAKEAMLHHLSTEIKGDLDRIHRITHTVESLSNDSITFLARAQELINECQSTLSKTYSEDIPVQADDLPKELPEIRGICEDYSPFKSLSEFKDEVIWRLKAQGKHGKAAVMQGEIGEWAKLTERLAQELSRVRMNCEMCGCALEEGSVNGVCSQGKGRHFFVRQAKAPPAAFSRLRTPPNRDSTTALLTHLRSYLIPLTTLLHNADPSHSGSIQASALYHLLVKHCAFSEPQAAQIVERYDYGQSGVVGYGEMLRELEGGQGEEVPRKLRVVMDKLRSKDNAETGVVKEKKFRKALVKAGIPPDDLEKVLQSAVKPSEGSVKYLETLGKWLNP